MMGGLTMAKFDFPAFVRECYLRSTPSVDLNKVKSKVNCSDHRLSVEEYKRILVEFGVTDENEKPIDPNSNLLAGLNIWMIQQGPSLYEAL